jgi:hypothetical protein
MPLASSLNAYFSVFFSVIDSDSAYGGGSEARDTFGFRLENGSGSNLFSFFLIPYAQSSFPESNINLNVFAYSTGVGAPISVLPGWVAVEGNSYTFDVQFAPSGPNDVSFVGSVGGQTFGGVLTNLAGENIGRLGAFWNTLNGKDAPGSNYLLFDNIVLIPEPSSLLLGLMSVWFAFARRRRT